MDSITLPSVDADTAASTDDYDLLDVREYQEWMSGHAPDAIHIPMSALVAGVGELDRTGGMSAWAGGGHPIINHAGNPGVVI